MQRRATKFVCSSRRFELRRLRHQALILVPFVVIRSFLVLLITSLWRICTWAEYVWRSSSKICAILSNLLQMYLLILFEILVFKYMERMRVILALTSINLIKINRLDYNLSIYPQKSAFLLLLLSKKRRRHQSIILCITLSIKSF